MLLWPRHVQFTSAGADLPSIRVDMDFTNNPTSATRSWTGITQYCKDFTVERGRENELSPSTPGRLEILLDNLDRRFDPSYTSGPYYPNVLPTRRIRVRAKWGTSIFNLFSGYVDDWPLEWPDGGLNAIVRVTATDAFKVLNLHDLDGESYAAQLSSARVVAVLNDAGFLVAGDEYAVETGQSTMVASGTLSTGSGGLAHLQDVVTSENGVFFVNGGGVIVFQDRHYRIKNKSEAVATLGDAAGEVPYVNPVVPYGDQYLWNRAIVTPSGGTAEISADTGSTAAYYTRTLTRSSLVESQAEALSNAQYLVSRYATPSVRVDAVDVIGASGTAHWASILGWEIGDRLVFTRRPPGGGTITLDQHAEQIGHRVTISRDWKTTLRMSPADSQAYWVLGDAANSLLGDTTRLMY